MCGITVIITKRLHFTYMRFLPLAALARNFDRKSYFVTTGSYYSQNVTFTLVIFDKIEGFI